MKTFIKTHKKIYISLGIIFMLILGFVIWIETRIGLKNLPLNKISGTIESSSPPSGFNHYSKLYIKLNNPSSWPQSAYAYAHYNINNIKKGDKVYLLCSDRTIDTSPSYLTVSFMWKEQPIKALIMSGKRPIKAFILFHKKLCIVLLITFILLVGLFVWFRRHIDVDNLPLHKVSGTVKFTRTICDADGEEIYIGIKLDDPSSWPKCEYVDIRYDEGNLKTGDRISMICGRITKLSNPPGLSAYWVWKK